MKNRHVGSIGKALLCILLLVIVMVFGFTACKKKNRTNNTNDSKSESSSSGKNTEKAEGEDGPDNENKDEKAEADKPDEKIPDNKENNENNDSDDKNGNNDTVTYDNLVNEGSSYFYSGDYTQAISTFEKAVNMDPSRSMAYIQMYYVYMNIGDIDSAEAVVNRGLSKVTDNTGILTLNILSENIKKEREKRSGTSEDITLTVWCTSDYTLYRSSFTDAITDMQTRFPNIHVQMETFEIEAYKEKLKAAVQSDDLPDIFSTWTGSFLKEFVSKNRIYCLDDALKDYIGKDIDKGKFSSATFDGKIYGVPMNMNVAVLFANMDLLEKVGYSYVPQTYEELMDCCDRLLEAGITPFGCTGNGVETWCVSEYFEPMAEKIIGADSLRKIFIGEETYNNSGLALAVDLLCGMIGHGYFDPNAVNLGNEEVKDNFIKGQYAFYLNGSWNCADFCYRAGFKVQVAEFPVINSSEASLGQFVGGPYECLSVAQSSRYASAAAEYAVELAKAVSHYGYLEGVGLPSWNVDYDDSSVNYIARQAAELCKNAEFSCFADCTMTADETVIYYKYLSLVFYGGIDGGEFIKGLTSDIR